MLTKLKEILSINNFDEQYFRNIKKIHFQHLSVNAYTFPFLIHPKKVGIQSIKLIYYN